MDSPAIRNSWTRVALRRIRSFPPDDRALVLTHIGKPTQATITQTRSDEWLPIELAIEVCDALVGGLGRKRAVEFWSNVVYDSWVGGLLEPLISTMNRPGGLGLLALAPAAWALSARDCGEVAVVGDGSSRLRLEARGLPAHVRTSLGIQVMYAGALEAMLTFSKLDATVEILDPEGADGPLAFRLAF